jgi:hypothetical protein
MPGSTVLAAKDALIALLEAHDWDDPAPTIRWGQPPELEKGAYDLVYLAGTETTTAHQVLGRSRADESYRLRIVVDVQRGGDNERAVEVRARALEDEVIGLLNDNQTLSGSVNRLQDHVSRQENFPVPGLWRTQIVIEMGVVGLIFNP